MPIAIASAPLPVRSRARGGSRPRHDADALTASCEAGAIRIVRVRDTADRDKAAAETLQRLLKALEAPPVDEGARARLARLLDRHGAPHVTLLVRTILESEGNANALVEPRHQRCIFRHGVSSGMAEPRSIVDCCVRRRAVDGPAADYGRPRPFPADNDWALFFSGPAESAAESL
jgi:hypothetical protein